MSKIGDLKKSCDCEENCFCMVWKCPYCGTIVRNQNEFCCKEHKIAHAKKILNVQQTAQTELQRYYQQ